MRLIEVSTLLIEVVTFAQDVSLRPLGDISARREHCEFLEHKLQEAIAVDPSARRYLENFAPLLLTAIRGLLARRNWSDDLGAAKWDALIGHLTPLTREDSAAALMASREVLTERPTR